MEAREENMLLILGLEGIMKPIKVHGSNPEMDWHLNRSREGVVLLKEVGYYTCSSGLGYPLTYPPTHPHPHTYCGYLPTHLPTVLTY